MEEPKEFIDLSDLGFGAKPGAPVLTAPAEAPAPVPVEAVAPVPAGFIDMSDLGFGGATAPAPTPTPERSFASEVGASLVRGGLGIAKLVPQVGKIIGSDVAGPVVKGITGRDLAKEAFTPMIKGIEDIARSPEWKESAAAGGAPIDLDRIISNPGEVLGQITSQITNPRFWAAQLPEGAMSMIPAIVGAWAPRAVALGGKLGTALEAAKVAGDTVKVAEIGKRINRLSTIGMYGMAMAMEAGQGEEKVRNYDEAHPDKPVPWGSRVVSILGTGVVAGALEAFSLGRILPGGALGQPGKSAVAATIENILNGKGGREIVNKVLAGVATEGLTEGAQSIVENAFPRGFFDKNQKLLEGVVESMLIGAALGGLGGGAGGIAQHLDVVQTEAARIQELKTKAQEEAGKTTPVGEPTVEPPAAPGPTTPFPPAFTGTPPVVTPEPGAEAAPAAPVEPPSVIPPLAPPAAEVPPEVAAAPPSPVIPPEAAGPEPIVPEKKGRDWWVAGINFGPDQAKADDFAAKANAAEAKPPVRVDPPMGVTQDNVAPEILPETPKVLPTETKVLPKAEKVLPATPDQPLDVSGTATQAAATKTEKAPEAPFKMPTAETLAGMSDADLEALADQAIAAGVDVEMLGTGAYAVNEPGQGDPFLERLKALRQEALAKVPGAAVMPTGALSAEPTEAAPEPKPFTEYIKTGVPGARVPVPAAAPPALPPDAWKFPRDEYIQEGLKGVPAKEKAAVTRSLMQEHERSVEEAMQKQEPNLSWEQIGDYPELAQKYIPETPTDDVWPYGEAPNIPASWRSETPVQTRDKKITEHEQIVGQTKVNAIAYSKFIDIVKAQDWPEAQRELHLSSANFTKDAFDHHFNPLNLMARLVEGGMSRAEAKVLIKDYDIQAFKPVREALGSKKPLSPEMEAVAAFNQKYGGAARVGIPEAPTVDYTGLAPDIDPVATGFLPATKSPTFLPTYKNFPTERLELVPEIFQHKREADPVTGGGVALTDIKKYDQTAAGNISVFETKDGRFLVSNGHQRTNAAKRLNEPTVGIQVRREVDGWTQQEVRVASALENLKGGTVDALDIGSYLRETGLTADDLAAKGVSLTKGEVQKGIGLSGLPDRIWTDVYRGAWGHHGDAQAVEKGAALGALRENPAAQEAIYKRLMELQSDGKDLSLPAIRNLVDAGRVAIVTEGQQKGLFGDEDVVNSRIFERAALVTYIQKELTTDKNAHLAANRERDRLEAAGNVIDAKANKAIAERAKEVLGVFGRSSKVGWTETSRVLNEFAERFAQAKDLGEENAIKREALAEIHSALEADYQAIGRADLGQATGRGPAGKEPGFPGGERGPGAPLGVREPGYERPLTKFEKRLNGITSAYPNADPERVAQALRAAPKSSDRELAGLAAMKPGEASGVVRGTMTGMERAELAKRSGMPGAALFPEMGMGGGGGLFDQAPEPVKAKAPEPSRVPAGARPAVAEKAVEKPPKETALAPAERWNSLKLGDRFGLIREAGWVTGRGHLTQLGEKILRGDWDSLSPAAKKVLTQKINEAYPGEFDHLRTAEEGTAKVGKRTLKQEALFEEQAPYTATPEERQGWVAPGEPKPSFKEFEAELAKDDYALERQYRDPANKLIPLYEGETYLGTRGGDFIKDAKGKTVKLTNEDIYERLYNPKTATLPIGTETAKPEDLLGTPDEPGPEGTVEKPPGHAGSIIRSIREKFSAANISEKSRLAHQFIVEHLGWAAREVKKDAAILDKYSERFGKMTREDLIKFTDAAETGNLDLVAPDLQEAAQTWRRISDGLHSLLVDAKGGESAYWENYFPRLFENQEQAAIAIAAMLKSRGTSLTGPESFNKVRTQLLFSDSIKPVEEGGLGLTPRYPNYVDMMKANIYEKMRFLTGKYIQADLIESGFITKKKTSGWEALTGDKTLEGYYAHPDVARVMENFLSKGLRGDPLFELYNNPASFMNTVMVGMSAFHATFSTFSDLAHGIGSNLTRAIGAAVTGRFGLSGHYLAEMAKAANIPANLMRGGKLGAEYAAPGTHPEMSAIVDLMTKAGIRFDSPGFKETLKAIFKPGGTSQTEMGQMSKSFAEVAAQQIGVPRKVMEAIAWPIMSYMVPRIKINATARLLQMELDTLVREGKMKDMTPQDLTRLAQEVARKSDNIFGQMVYDNLSMKRGMRDALRILIGFPGWNIGSFTDIHQTAKGIFQIGRSGIVAAKDIVTGQKVKPWEKLSRSNRMSMEFYLGTALVMAVFGAFMQRILKGDWPEDHKDLFMPQTGELMSNGQPERLRAPTYMRDVLSLNHPVEMLKHKLNWPLRMVSALVDNQDFFGTQIRDPYAGAATQAGQVGKYVGKSLLPFGIQGYLATDSPKARALNLIGITKVPRLYSNSDAMNELDIYNKMNRASITSKEAEAEKELKGNLRKLAKAGDGEGFAEAAKAAVSDGILTRNQVNTVVTESQMPPGLGRFAAAPLQWQLRALAVATDAEKQAWTPLLLKKVASSSPEIKIRNRDALLPVLREMGLDGTADALENLAVSEKGSTFKLAGLGIRRPAGEMADTDTVNAALVNAITAQEAKLGTEAKARAKKNKYSFLGIQ